jgi:NADH:ubiquinone oxidoreductase subunit D
MIQERITLGPIHLSLPGAMELRLGMVGDRIESVETTFGFLSRSIETAVIGMPYPSAQLRVARIDPESSLILDRLFSEAVEAITATEVSPRALWVREITTAMTELNGFLRYLSRMSGRLGVEVLTHVTLKHRESLLDLTELLTGSRFGYYYLVPGGVRYDLTEGFQERLENWIKNFSLDFPRIEALFRWTHAFQNRLQSIGRVVDNANFGFVSESSIETTRYGLVSHVESRLLFALEQTNALSDELRSLLAERFTGQPLFEIAKARSKKSVHVDLVSARGTWALELALDEALVLKSIHTTVPSDAIIAALPLALEDESFEDLPLILESLNFSIPEIDR